MFANHKILFFQLPLIGDDGNKLHLEKKNKEHLSEPVTVYNFAVEDYHTYFVGENDVLVHNKCGLDFSEKAGQHMAEKARYVPMMILQKVI